MKKVIILNSSQTLCQLSGGLLSARMICCFHIPFLHPPVQYMVERSVPLGKADCTRRMIPSTDHTDSTKTALPRSLTLLPVIRAAHEWAEQHWQEGQSENRGCSQKTEGRSLQRETALRKKSLRHCICLILIQSLSNSLPSSFYLATDIGSRVLPQNFEIHCLFSVQLTHTAHPREMLWIFSAIFFKMDDV